MRWAILVLGFVAGCYDPNAHAGAPCGENGACPGSLVCVDGLCQRPGGGGDDAAINPDGPPIDGAMIDTAIDAFVPDGPPNDVDGDGVANSVDNCPQLANADQHDEDQDFVGDPCDNCPHVPNMTQTNVMDNDSVGDVCDPNPTMGGDAIAKFIAFNGTAAGTTTEGVWSQGGDMYIHGTNTDSALIVTGGPWTTPTIDIGAQVVSNVAAGPVWIAAVIGEGAGPYAWCGYEDEANGTSTDFHRGATGHGTGTNWIFDDAFEHGVATRLAGAFSIRLSGDATTDNFDCRHDDARGILVTPTRTTPFNAGNAGIRGDGIAYQVNYIVVFTR